LNDAGLAGNEVGLGQGDGALSKPDIAGNGMIGKIGLRIGPAQLVKGGGNGLTNIRSGEQGGRAGKSEFYVIKAIGTWTRIDAAPAGAGADDGFEHIGAVGDGVVY